LKKEIPSLILNKGLVIRASREENPYLSEFSMAFVTGDNQKIHAFMTCRDYLHDVIRTCLNNETRVSGDGHAYHPRFGDPKICLDRLRLLFRIKNERLSLFETGLFALNTMEKNAKDIELTSAQIVKLEGEQSKLWTNILITGSKEYMDVPHLLSLVTLILRFFTMNPKMKYKKIGDLTKVYKALCKDNKIAKDKFLMGTCHKWLHYILLHRAELFADKTSKQLFPVNMSYEFHAKGGVAELCKLNTPNTDVNERMKALQKRYKERIM